MRGRAVGLTAFVRAIPFDLARGRVRIPTDLLAQRQLNPAMVLGAQDQFGLKDAASGLLTLVQQAMAEVRRAGVPGHLRPAFYHASLR